MPVMTTAVVQPACGTVWSSRVVRDGRRPRPVSLAAGDRQLVVEVVDQEAVDLLVIDKLDPVGPSRIASRGDTGQVVLDSLGTPVVDEFLGGAVAKRGRELRAKPGESAGLFIAATSQNGNVGVSL